MGQYAARDLVRVPGLLSLARIPLGFVFPLVVDRPAAAIAVLGVAAMTDVADGWYARRFHQETPTGRILDAITDKIFVTIVVFTMIVSGMLSIGEASLLATREICEFGLLAGWALARRHRPRPARGANRLGKVATVMQFATVAAILLGTPQPIAWLLPTALCGVLSGVSYAVREWRTA
jgi:phosphatidylglycerophosphate synthase